MQKKKTFGQRIISLTPSLTETLFALESSHRVAGVTDSCDHPPRVQDRPNVACWFAPDLEKLFALKPDFVLGLQTAHRKLKPTLESQGIPVLLVNPTTVDEAIADIVRIGKILGVLEKSESLAADLYARLSAVQTRVRAINLNDRLSACRILDLEGDRLHVAGPLSFQYDIIAQAGGRNVSDSIREAYPKITLGFKVLPTTLYECYYPGNEVMP
jgi:iron complex transport system substrate-binding protein